jgi:hypothetical protein
MRPTESIQQVSPLLVQRTKRLPQACFSFRTQFARSRLRLLYYRPMSTTHSLIRSSRFLFAVIILLTVASCKKSHDEAKKIERTETQLELPEMSAEKKKIADQHLEWNMETLYDAYDKIGSNNKKWNAEAHGALKFFAQVRSYGSNLKGFPELLEAFAHRAVELGCDDPMIGYLHARFAVDKTQMSRLEIAKLYARASDQIESSRYAPIRKFYAANRAVENYLEVRPWPDEGNTYIDRATQNYYAVLADKKTPAEEIQEAGSELLKTIDRCRDGKSRYDQMEALLLKNWSKHGVSYLLQGRFYIDYAWEGRTGKYANEVTDEQWKMFFDRLKLAENCLKKGMEIDPKEGRLPMEMITVVSAQNKELPEMQYWWERAMEANPNNYDACDKLLNFLLPKWGGSREDMLAFGRKCATSDQFGGTVPLILVEAHYKYNKQHGATDGSYWLEPDVWPDLKMAYEKFFQLNPKGIYWRSYYARFAWWCQQWETMLEQMELAGDDINYNLFDGREKFDEIVQFAKEQISGATKTGAPAK